MPLWIRRWLDRHQHPASRALHAVGIPILAAGLVLGAWQLAYLQWSLWWRPAAMIAGSYVMQWIGHRIEGNDMGEVILLKRLTNRPYTAISARYAPFSDPPSEPEGDG
mgnify:CR=1 FL=1